MIEFPECHKVGTYNPPPELIAAFQDAAWQDDPWILRPTTGQSSRVIYFPTDPELNGLYGQELSPEIKKVQRLVADSTIKMLNHILPGYSIVKGEVSLLKHGTQIKHQDPRVFQRRCKRLHWPIITNSDAHLCIGDNKYHIPMNEIWTFDNVTDHHWSQNFGAPRWHVIIDVIEQVELTEIMSLITRDEFYSIWRHWLLTTTPELLKNLKLEQAALIPSRRATY